jgi:hypothetical protein
LQQRRTELLGRSTLHSDLLRKLSQRRQEMLFRACLTELLAECGVATMYAGLSKRTLTQLWRSRSREA